MTEQEFVVRDKRHFGSDGQGAEEEEGREETGGPAGPAAAGPGAGEAPREKAGQSRGTKTCEGPPPLPEVNFSTFIFSISTSALMNLGEVPDPNTGQTCHNLPLAKQTIDILAMLQNKTKGNLDGEEENLLVSMLYELRMKYVAAVRNK
jgi:hypothetical protein